MSDNADKDFIVVADGFSHYHAFGIPGECFDERLVRAYRDSDVRILMAQIAGGTLWDSEVTSYFGAGVSPAEYHGKRIGDVRAMKYVKDSIENKYEVFRTATEACHKNGMEMHFSIRANLYGH